MAAASPSPVPEGARIEVCEVGPRDGFQIERAFIPTNEKIAIVNGLARAGIRKIQATSFVSPRAVPQLADAEDVLAGIERTPGLVLTALVPNARGAERAARTQLDVMGLFCSASETHSRKNVNASIEDTPGAHYPPSFLEIREPVADRAGVEGGLINPGAIYGCLLSRAEVRPALPLVRDRAVLPTQYLGIVDLNRSQATSYVVYSTTSSAR